MLVKIKLAWFLTVMSMLLAVDARALTYMDPNDGAFAFRSLLNDSIPLLKRERVVIETKGLVAYWVVALSNLNYAEMKQELEDSIGRDYGIEEAKELDVPLKGQNPIDLNNPNDPLFGMGFLGFIQSGVEMNDGREYQIVSRKYNVLADVEGYSVSKWRIGDGSRIFGRGCSLIVMQRTDFSREWARGHMGLPWPFKTSGATGLVTETEITRVDRIVASRTDKGVRYFVPYPGYKFDNLLNLMKLIIDESKVFCPISE
jgi:hypothetical protein